MRGDQDNFSQFELNMKAAFMTLAPIVANEATNFFRGNFDAQAWRGTAMQPWKKRSAKAKRNKGRAILVDSGRLRRSIRDMGSAGTRVIVGTDVEYAHPHNQGFKGTVTVGAFSRRGRKSKKAFPVKSHSRRMNMPQRQFIGNSPWLNQRIDRAILIHLNRHL